MSFKARAFEGAASQVESISDEGFSSLLKADQLEELPGVGRVISAQIQELVAKGTSRFLEGLRAEFPKAIFELATIKGVSLSKATALHEGLGIRSIEALEEACRDHQVRTLPGFGPKTEAKILEAIESKSSHDGRMRLHEARRQADIIVQHLKSSPLVLDTHVVGELRRFTETVDSIEVLCVTHSPGAVIAHFAALPFLVRFEEVNAGAAKGMLSNGCSVRLHTCDELAVGTALVIRTGSTEHVSALEKRASLRGLVLDAMSHRTEDEIYQALGLPFMPPEIREDEQQIRDVEAGSIRLPLVTVDDLKGVVHCHTVFSDGTESVEEMAREAERRHYGYITITDHSQAAYYAGGVPADVLPREWAEILEAERSVGIRVLRGTEADILADGSIDYGEEILEQLDVVIASIHSRFKMDAEQMTSRLLRALRSRLFKIWGHPLGRLLLRRDPIACDVEAVLDAVAESRAAIEINGEPYRLDLAPHWIRVARERGIRFVVSTDAHGKRSMNNVELAVAMARRGGLSAREVLNTLDADGFIDAVRPRERR